MENPKEDTEKKKEAKPKMNFEIDYSELPYALLDKNKKKVKPLLLVIVHPESYFIAGSHLASPNDNYLQEFLKEITRVIKNGPFLPTKILVKKKIYLIYWKKI